MRARPSGARPVSIQIAIVVAICALLVLGVVVTRLVSLRVHHVVVAATPGPVPSGYFALTDDEWRGLTRAQVHEMSFADVSQSDGTVAAPDDTTTQVISPFTGRVTDVFVTVGDAVTKGQPLFAGEGQEYAQALNDLAQAVAALYGARAALVVVEKDRARLENLLRYDGAARKDVEQRGADLAAARATVRTDEIAVAMVRSRLRILGQNPDADGAGLSVSNPRSLRSKVVVRSPIDGIVTARAVGNGANVQSAENGASTPLLTITGLAHVFFVANATEDEIARVEPGDPVTVRMSAFPGRLFHARVRYISPTVDPNLHRIAVRAEVDNPDGSLRPGMYGTVEIFVGSPTRAVAVPEDAVIYEEDSAHVWVTGPNHTLAIRFIRTGKTLDGMVEVFSGLRAGETVVTSGSVFIDRALRGDE